MGRQSHGEDNSFATLEILLRLPLEVQYPRLVLIKRAAIAGQRAEVDYAYVK